MRDHAHLRARGRVHAAAMRIRHCMAYATHTFFHNHGFCYIHTPILTGADCEGAGEQFGVTTMLGSDHLATDIELSKVEPPPVEDTSKLSKSELKRRAKKAEKEKSKIDPTKPVHEDVVGAVDYTKDFFGKRVNLTVSGQLNVETHACALSDVYTFGPTFRAENSHTGRHLAEFWMIEPEICFADLADDINLAEDYLKYCVRFALENCAEDLEFFENSPHGEVGLRERLKNVLDNPFKRLTYTEAIEVLQKAVKEDGVVFEEEPIWGIDLPSEHERYLCEKVYKKPVVLMDYPKDIKAFYMKLNDDKKTVAAADILVPKIGEIIGGSQREHRMDVLKTRCEEMGLDAKQVWWYLDLRRYGTVPHAGFGLGFERLILFITGLQNIRDVIPFPRYPQNAEF
uniref:asparagine--tRNA ligase n=1 Tax=Pseudo-nitzschia australis TaxID=44445 RepID=A0A7S4ABG7_9STRA